MHNLSFLAFPSAQPTRVAPATRPLAWLRRASESQPSSPEAELNSNFLQNSQNPPLASGAWRHLHSLATFPIWAIVTSLSDTSAPRACTWTLALMLHLSNPCTEPKGSQPNSTQRHKTKSLGHYITYVRKADTYNLKKKTLIRCLT